MSYTELITADIRLVVLRALAEDPGYSHNEIIIANILEMMGHKVSRDRLRAELAWLSEQGLLKTEAVAGMQVATLTGRGADVASGASSCPGVKRPVPED